MSQTVARPLSIAPWKTRAAAHSLLRRAALWTFVSVLWSRGIRYAVIGARLLDAIKRAGHERMYTGGVVGLLGMMIFNTVVIVDTARKLWKFGVRTPMPLENARVAKDS